MSSNRVIPCLLAYSVLTTTLLVVVSTMYWKTVTVTMRQHDNIGTQEVQGKRQTHVDFNSNEQQLREKGNCETLEWLFWIIILSLTGIGIIYCGFRCTQEGKQWFGKWKDARNSAAEERKFEKIRMKYVISTLELAGYGNEDEF